jgi:hypothetical protein
MVRSAPDDFYGMLADEQKAQFDAIGRQGHRVDLFERPRAARPVEREG